MRFLRVAALLAIRQLHFFTIERAGSGGQNASAPSLGADLPGKLSEIFLIFGLDTISDNQNLVAPAGLICRSRKR